MDWAGRRAPGGALRRAPGVVLGSADRALAQRAVANLLDNAAKWTPAGGAVVVALDDEALTVADDGPGIDPADLPRVFERFYRAPAARGMPGAGLGLAIVRKVADAHGWQATASNAGDRGARFGLLFDPAPVPLLTRAGPRSGDAIGPVAADGGSRWPLLRRLAHHPAPLWAGVLAVAALPLLAALEVAGFGDDRPARLTTTSGTLARCDAQFCVADTVVDFGPDWYLASTQAEHDFDADGRRGLLASELDGLVGRPVVLETDGGRLDADVYTLNGLPYRDPTGALTPPPDAEPSAAADPAPSPRAVVPTAVRLESPVTLRGVLARCAGGYCLAGIPVHFGPAWYVTQANARHDYDGDGHLGTIAGELAGLEGDVVTLHVGDGADDTDVYAVNGLPYRDPESPPPWTGGPLVGVTASPSPAAGPSSPAEDQAPAPTAPASSATSPAPAEETGVAPSAPPNGQGPPDDAGPPGHAPAPVGAGPPPEAGEPRTLSPSTAIGPAMSGRSQ